MAESDLLNGVDLLSIVYSIQVKRGLVGPPPMRGGNYEVPRRPGSISGARWAGPRVAQIGGLLYGNNGATLVPADARARYDDRLRALSALVMNNGADSVYTRTIARSGTSDLTVTASCCYRGGLDSIEQVAAHGGKFMFDLEFFDPFWYSTTDTTIAAFATTASPSIPGDVQTRRATLTFSGSTNQRLTNNTTGEWVQIVGNAGTPTVVDLENFTATRASVSKDGEVTHNGSFDDWLTFMPGTNSLTLTGGGTVSAVVRGAWL